MNIQQYYRTLAGVFLNGSLAAFIPVFLILFVASIWLQTQETVFLAIPFLLYSFISYQNYIINRERSEKAVITTKKQKNKTLLKESQYLLTFLPAPSLRLLLFEPTGYVNGEIRDINNSKIRWFLPYFLDKLLPAEYGLYNHENELIKIMKWKRRRADIMDGERNLLFSVERLGGNLYLLNTKERSNQILLEIDSIGADIRFVTSLKKSIARVRKGWMPLEWGQGFQDGNTPIISFDEELSSEQRVAIWTILVYLFRYRNH